MPARAATVVQQMIHQHRHRGQGTAGASASESESESDVIKLLRREHLCVCVDVSICVCVERGGLRCESDVREMCKVVRGRWQRVYASA